MSATSTVPAQVTDPAKKPKAPRRTPVSVPGEEMKGILNASRLKTMLSPLGLTLHKSAVPYLVKQGQDVLDGFVKSIANQIENGDTAFDRDIVPGAKDEQANPLFVVAPFRRALKNRVKSELDQKKITSRNRWQEAAFQKALRSFQYLLNQKFQEDAKKSTRKKGSNTLITAEIWDPSFKLAERKGKSRILRDEVMVREEDDEEDEVEKPKPNSEKKEEKKEDKKKEETKAEKKEEKKEEKKADKKEEKKEEKVEIRPALEDSQSIKKEYKYPFSLTEDKSLEYVGRPDQHVPELVPYPPPSQQEIREYEHEVGPYPSQVRKRQQPTQIDLTQDEMPPPPALKRRKRGEPVRLQHQPTRGELLQRAAAQKSVQAKQAGMSLNESSHLLE